MSTKKKILFYSYLLTGPMNACSAIGTNLLDKYYDGIEIYFVTDLDWAEKLKKKDSRFKCEIYKPTKNGEKDDNVKAIENSEKLLDLSLIERYAELYKIFAENVKNLVFIEEQIFEIIEKIKPDFIFCELLGQTPSVVKSKIPYSFLISSNPLLFNFDGFPHPGLDVGMNEKEKIKSSRIELEKALEETKKKYKTIFEIMNVKYNKDYSIFSPISDYFSIYLYPQEIDYFDDQIREKYKLLQIDSTILKSKIPPPYELPEEFVKLPGKIIYVSLGSLFSCYYTKIQKLIDILATLPYKYIVSKGPNGGKIKFPDNRFIGENFINQLAVLQVVDMMIAHGGNNTLTECFYFGVPSIIIPVMFDQINNGKRIEETEYGYQLNLMNYTQEELSEKIKKTLLDESLNEKMKKASIRIKSDNKLEKVVDKFYQYLKGL